VSARSIVTDSYRKEGEVCPINGVEVCPSFNMGVYSCPRQKIHQETDCLKHQSPLAHRQLELLVIMTPISTPNGDEHQGCNEEVQPCRKDCIIVRLSEGMI